MIKRLIPRTLRAKIFAILIAFAIAAGAYFYFHSPKTTFSVVKVAQGTIAEEVSVTGKTTPVSEVHLSFEKPGRVDRILADVGQRINTGETLAVLDQSGLLAQLKNDEAGRDAAQAKLDALKKGTRPEEIAVDASALASADQILANDYVAALDALRSSYTTANDAVRNKTNGMFLNSETTSPQITFNVADIQAQSDFIWYRVLASNALNDWQGELAALPASPSPQQMENAISKGQTHLGVASDFLNRGIALLNKTVSLSGDQLFTYKTNLTTAVQNVNGAVATVNADYQAILAQKTARDKAKKELDLARAAATPEDVANGEAVVKQASAKIAATQAELAKTVLKSPLDGTVTRQDFKVGEIAPATQALLSIISANNLEVDAAIPEADIGKVKVGNPAEITLDTYGNGVVFDARVVSIDPAETVIEGVSTYKTTFVFLQKDERVKPGMTANIDITTQKHENALFVPQRSVAAENGKKFVWLVDGSRAAKIEIQTGIRAADGNVEVTGGLKEGEFILRAPPSAAAQS